LDWFFGAEIRDVACLFLQGYQKIIKGHYRGSSATSASTSTASTSTSPPRPALETSYILISLAVLRLENQSTDLVISSNYPIRDEVGIHAIHADLETVRGYIEGNGEAREAERLVLEVVSSLEVLDWELFDEGDEEMGSERSES